jgi:hypothetical protein
MKRASEVKVAGQWNAAEAVNRVVLDAGARPVLDDELLTEPLREPLTDQAREDVGAVGGGKGSVTARAVDGGPRLLRLSC